MTDTVVRFRVALTGDFFAPDGATRYPDLGLSVFEGQDHLDWTSFAEHRATIGADQVAGVQGVIVLTVVIAYEVVRRYGVRLEQRQVAAALDPQFQQKGVSA